MILGPLISDNPLADPHLHWCEVGFSVADVQGLTHAGVTVALPDDLTSAVPKRRSEFLAGRFCAAMALRAAGLPEHVARQGRAPVWPAGCSGSITHSQSRAIAVVSTHSSQLGIDCEALVPDARATSLRGAIFTDEEAALRPETMPFGTFFTLIFSAKEALYKARSPFLNRVPAFLEVTASHLTADSVTLTLDGVSGQARYRLTKTDCVTLISA